MIIHSRIRPGNMLPINFLWQRSSHYRGREQEVLTSLSGHSSCLRWLQLLLLCF